MEISDHTILSTNDRHYGTEVFVSCLEGNNFKQEEYTGEVAIKVECLLGGRWDKEGRMPDCQGIALDLICCKLF